MLFIGSHAPETDENEDSPAAAANAAAGYKRVRTQTTVREKSAYMTLGPTHTFVIVF